MREGLTRNNPIKLALYEKYYPKTPLPESSYVSDRGKLFFNRKSQLNLLGNIKGGGVLIGGKNKLRTKSSSKVTPSAMRKLWEKRWDLEIVAQKKSVINSE